MKSNNKFLDIAVIIDVFLKYFYQSKNAHFTSK